MWNHLHVAMAAALHYYPIDFRNCILKA